MKVSIENKAKLDIFVAIFQLLKNWGSYLSLQFEPEQLYIQSMDKSHICLSNIIIKSAWFSEYDIEMSKSITVDAVSFAIIMNYALKHNKLDIIINNPDKIFINFSNNKESKKRPQVSKCT